MGQSINFQKAKKQIQKQYDRNNERKAIESYNNKIIYLAINTENETISPTILTDDDFKQLEDDFENIQDEINRLRDDNGDDNGDDDNDENE